MIERKERESTEINASSMADIAFLLLIFFLVTTTIASDKGITMQLPPYMPDLEKPPPVKEKNVLKVQLNSADKLQVEEEFTRTDEVKEITRKFLSNNGRDPKSSDNPRKAVVSIKTDRGTTYAKYAVVLDQIKAAYYELRAESLGIPLARYMEILNKKKQDRSPEEQDFYKQAKENYPLKVSEAEPTKN